MKCLLCEKLSLVHICKNCQSSFLQPALYKRKVQGIEVISFYKYHDIKDLLHTKHTDLGYYIYNILAQNSFKKFTLNFNLDFSLAAIAIDDTPKNLYSHTAILSNALKSKVIKPLFNKLRAKNNISYAGKSKEFRLLNPRKFKLQTFLQNDIILIDDIITTGTTINEAITELKSNNKEVLFCLTLADSAQ